MTRTDLLTALRELNPEKANLSDEQLLWDAGSKAQQDGSIEQYPALQTEMIRQQAAYESADRGLLENAWDAGKRGFARGAQGANAAAGMDDTNAQDVADWEKVAAANPNSPEYTDFMQAEGFGASAKAFAKAPVRILSEMMAESAAQSLPAMAGGFLGGAAQGAVVGAPTGPGEAITIPVGAAIGTALGSGYVEYGSKLLGVMQEAGMDASDPDSVKAFFNDPVRLANAKDLALKRGISVGLFDGATMGLSSKFGAPVVDAWRSGASIGARKVAGAIGTGLAIEAGGGMAGELAGQMTTGEDLDMKSIAVEGLAEMGSLPGSVAAGSMSRYRAPAQAVEAPVAVQQEATVQQRAPLQAEFGDVATTTPVPAPEAVPVVTETVVTAEAPVKVTPTKNAPVLATPAQQQMMVDTGEVHPEEAATFTISQAKAFLDDFADRQAAVEELNQDTSQEAAIEAAVARQSAARNLAAQQVAAEQAQLKADQEAVAQQARDFATARSNRIAAQQAQLAAQRNAVSSLDNNEGVAFQQMIGAAAPAIPAVQRNAAPSVLAQRQAADAQKAVAQTAVQQKKMFTAKAAATVASAAPVNTIAPVTAPLTRAVPVAEVAQTMSPKLASVNVAQAATEAAQVAPVAPAPVATPVAEVAASEPAAPVARMRDEFTSNNAVVAHSALVEPGATVESVAEVATLRKARSQVSGHNTNALVVLQDSNGEYHQVPIKQKAGSSKFYAQVHASRGEWISWVAEEAGVGRGSVDPALGGNSKLAAATVARIKDVASKYGYGQDKNTDLTKWLESNPQLRPVAYVTTEQPVQRGFRKANTEAVTAVIRQLDERKNAAAAAGTLPSESVPVIHSEAALEKVEAAVGDSPAEQVRELLGNKYYSLIQKLASIRDAKASAKDPKAGVKAAKAALDKVLLNYPEVRQAVVSVKGGYNAILDSLPENAAAKTKADSIAYPGSSPEAIAARQALADVLFAITDADLRNTALSHMAKNPGAARDAIVTHRKSNPKLAESMRLMTVEQKTAFYDALDNEVKAMADAAAVTVKNGSATMSDVLSRLESAPVRESSKDFLDTTDRFNNVLRSAAARGINIVQREATKFFKAGGAYVPSTRGISLVLDNVLSPSKSNLLTLVHEVVHDITETAHEPIRRALHDAFERIPAGELAFYGNPMADPRLSDGSLTGEALVTERMVEHLAVQGIDREYSTGVIATIYRSVKDVLLRGAMYLQGKLLGESNVSGELAKEWAENQVAAFIAGDKVRTQNFLQQFGITPQIGTIVRAVADDYSVVHFGTDGVSYERIPGADAINIAAAISGVKETAMANGTWTLDRDLKELSELLPAEVMQHVELTSDERDAAYVKLVRDIEEMGGAVSVADVFGKSDLSIHVLEFPERLRGSGLGRTAVERIVRYAQQVGASGIDVEPKNEGLSKFYQHMGFVPNGGTRSWSSLRLSVPSTKVMQHVEPTGESGDPAGHAPGGFWAKPGTAPGLPPVKNGFVRFFHGGVPGKGARWVSPIYAYALGYANKGAVAGHGTVQYVEIPESHPILEGKKSFDDSGTNMKSGYINFEMPADLMETAQLVTAQPPVPATPSNPQHFTREIASRIVQATQRELRIKAAAANALRPILLSLLKKVKGSQIEYTAAQKAQFKREGRPLPTAINELADLLSVLEVRDPSASAAKAETEAKKMLEAETGEEISGPLVNMGTTLDQLENGEIGEADREIASYISTLLGKTLVKKTSLEETVLKLSTGETSNRALIQAITANLNDTRTTVNEMLRNIASNFDSLRRGMKKVDGLSTAKGEAEATLDALLSEAERRERTQERMEKALNSIDIKEQPLGAALRDLYNLGLELDTAPVSEIRSRVKEAVLLNPDSPLAAFVSIGEGPNASLRGTVLLSSMIRFVKSEALTAEVLRAQMGRTKDDVAQLNEVRSLFQETNTDKLTELANQMRAFRPTGNADKLGDQPIPTPRLAHRMLKAWEKALKKQIQLAEAERDLSILRAALPAFTTLDRQAAQRLSVGNNFQFHSGSMYMDPKDPTTSEEFLTAAPNLKPLLLSGPQAMSAEQLRDLLNRTRDWIKARKSDPSLQGEVYQTMKRQEREIARNMFGDKIHKLVSGIFNGRLEGLAHLFIKSGTRSGEVAARMLVRFEGIGRLFAPKDSTNGQRWETLRDNVIRLMEIEPQQMKEMFSDPARTLMQWFQGTEREAFAVLESRFNGEPATAEFFSKPGVSAAFFEMMRDIPKQNAYLLEKMAHAGADRVLDPKLGGKERTHIDTGVPGYTTPMGVTRELRNWLHSFEHSFAIGEDASNPFRQVTRLLATNDGVNTMRASLARLFDDSGWTTFLLPLIENEAGGVPKPIGTDEIATIIHPDDAKELLSQSGNDLINFADAAFKRFGDGTEDGQRAYRETIVNWVNKTWASLDTQFVHREKTPFRGMLSVPEVSINARAAATYPSQWMTHVEFTPGDQRRLTHAVAMTGVFGRNGETMSKLVADIHTSLDSEKNELTALKTDADWEALKKLDKPKYSELRELQKYYVPDYDKQVGDIFNTESDAFVENKTILEIFAGMTAGMTAGMKSALKNLVTGANLLYLQRSVSGEALTTVGGAYAKTGKVFAAAMADCFGIRLFRNDPFVQAMNRAGAYDSATRTTLKDLVTGERGVDDNLSQFCRVLRMTRNVLTQTRLSPLSKNSPFTAMRMFNPFQFTQLAVNMANTWQLMQDYHALATGAAGFYKAGGDTKATLTAKDCGVQDATRFEALRSRMLDNGLSLEDLGKRIAAGKDILDGDFIQACNNISSGDLANEGGINNRPTAMSRSKMGRVAGTFVGWAIAQTQHPLRLMSSPEGRTDLMTLANATKVFALGILPMSLAFSAALDDWDELVGRKSNRRPLRLSDPQSISEAVVNVGTIGMLGDAVDFVSNTAQGTSGNSNLLSLDNRIVIVSSANAMITAVRNAAAMGDVNYANVARPLLQGMGAGGLLQNAYLMDRVLHLRDIPVVGSPFQAESSVVLRSNIQNYLRAAGREAGLEVRMAGGGGYTPTPMTPKVTDMLLAALRDDRAGFQTAYREAIKVAQAAGHPDPLKKVQEAFTARHPLKSLFNGTPTAAEVQKMMASMPDEGKRAVTDSLRLVNNYGASLGVAPFMGSPTMSGAQVVRQRKGVLEAMQARLAQDRGLF